MAPFIKQESKDDMGKKVSGKDDTGKKVSGEDDMGKTFSNFEMPGSAFSPLFEEYLSLFHEKGKDFPMHHVDPLGPEDALLVIDMQNDFVPYDAQHNPNGGSFGVAEGQKCIKPIVAMINHAASLGATVVATRDYHPVDHCSFITEGGPFPQHCVQGTEGSKLLPAIANALAAGKTAHPEKIHVVFKAFHEDTDSFGGLPYHQGDVYTKGGEGRVTQRQLCNTEKQCPMGCTKTPWSGSMLLKQSAITLAVQNGKVTAEDINAPPDILAILEDSRRNRTPLQELVKSCKRLFICGLALDYCCLDTAINARSCGFEKGQVFFIVDACRAAHIEKVGQHGTGFLNNPRDLIPTLEKAGVEITCTAKVAGTVAMFTPHDHLRVTHELEGVFPSKLAPLGFTDVNVSGLVSLSADNTYSVQMEGDFKVLQKLGWKAVGKCSSRGPILPSWPDAPEGATKICWAYPLADAADSTAKSMHVFFKLSRSDRLSFAIRGGFLLLNDAGDVLKVQMVTAGGIMEFEDPQTLPKEAVAKLQEQDRMQAVTLPFLIKKGAQHFCWLNPEESLPGYKGQANGAFAYLLEGRRNVLFPVKGFSKPIEVQTEVET